MSTAYLSVGNRSKLLYSLFAVKRARSSGTKNKMTSRFSFKTAQTIRRECYFRWAGLRNLSNSCRREAGLDILMGLLSYPSKPVCDLELHRLQIHGTSRELGYNREKNDWKQTISCRTRRLLFLSKVVWLSTKPLFKTRRPRHHSALAQSPLQSVESSVLEEKKTTKTPRIQELYPTHS